MQSYLNPAKYTAALQLDKARPEYISHYQSYGDNFSWTSINTLQAISQMFSMYFITSECLRELSFRSPHSNREHVPVFDSNSGWLEDLSLQRPALLPDNEVFIWTNKEVAA